MDERAWAVGHAGQRGWLDDARGAMLGQNEAAWCFANSWQMMRVMRRMNGPYMLSGTKSRAAVTSRPSCADPTVPKGAHQAHGIEDAGTASLRLDERTV